MLKNKIKILNSKRSQITVFIILAILISIVLILLFVGKENIVSFFSQASPADEVEKCAKESLEEGIEILEVQGGMINPENYYLYKGNKIEYLCYTEEYYKKCVMQKPLIKNEIKNELKEFSENRVNDCVESIRKKYEKRGYEISMKRPEVSIELAPNNVVMDINLNMEIRKDKTEFYNNVKTSVNSKLYSFSDVAGKILNSEVQYGDFEILKQMLLYPTMKVEKKIQGDGTKIYTLTDRGTEEKFMFATRSIAFPAGFIGKGKINE